MRSTLILTVLTLSFIAACNTTGVPTEFANARNADNEKKTIEVAGVIQPSRSVFCSNRGGRMECGFDFLEAPGSEKKFSADIEQGSGANTVDMLESGYKKEDVKIRDNAGNQIPLGSDKVKVTGKMSIVPAAAGNPGVCFMQVYKIER